MSTTIKISLVAVIAVLMAGCAREHVREMSSLKDTSIAPAAATKDRVRKEAAIEDRAPATEVADEIETDVAPATEVADDIDAESLDAAEQRAVADTVAGESAIETGSITEEGDCQGAHIAYQRTRKYLENLGPRPTDGASALPPCHRTGD